MNLLPLVVSLELFQILGRLFVLGYCDSEGNGGCGSYPTTAPCTDPLKVDQKLPHTTSIINTLLDNYDNLMRPHFNDNKVTRVTVDVFINSVDSVSVDTMDFSVNIYLRQSWEDPRLRFPENSIFSNISLLTLDSKLFDKIWVPDLFFNNEKKAQAHCITMPNRLIRIDPRGNVLYSSRYTLSLSCHMSLERYPFDTQECHMNVESYGYTTEEVEFVWRKNAENDSAVQRNPNLTLPQFELKEVTVGECRSSYITGDFTCLKAKFFLNREYGYFIVQNYIPTILIVILSWVSFWINMDAVPARISLGVMTVLTITTHCVGIWMALPRVSYVKAIDIWMSSGVAFVFLAMIEFALVNTLARKEIRRMSIKVRTEQKDDSGDLIKRMMDEHTYGAPSRYDPDSRMLARKVDKISRVIFPVSYIMFNLVYWCYYLIR